MLEKELKSLIDKQTVENADLFSEGNTKVFRPSEGFLEDFEELKESCEVLEDKIQEFESEIAECKYTLENAEWEVKELIKKREQKIEEFKEKYEK